LGTANNETATLNLMRLLEDSWDSNLGLINSHLFQQVIPT